MIVSENIDDVWVDGIGDNISSVVDSADYKQVKI